MNNKVTLLVDGTNIAMFASFGGKVDPSQSTFSALGCIQTAADKIGATTVIGALDGSTPTFRKALAPDYKAGRTTKTQPYVDKLRVMCKARHWITVTVEGFEADDVLATLSVKLPERCYILSSDSDVLALVNDSVTVLRPKKIREMVEWGRSEVIGYYGIEPHWLPLYKAIVGEPGDNVAGIPGMGPKKAVAIIRELGPAQNAYEHPLLAPHREHFALALQLTVLRTDIPYE